MSGTHANPLGMKTDAPWDVIWDIMRAWVVDHPVKKQVWMMSSSCDLSSSMIANFCRPNGGPVGLNLTDLGALRVSPAASEPCQLHLHYNLAILPQDPESRPAGSWSEFTRTTTAL